MDDLTAAQLAYLGMAAQVIPVLWVAAFLTGGEAGRRVTIVSAIPLGISAIGLAACISALPEGRRRAAHAGAWWIACLGSYQVSPTGSPAMFQLQEMVGVTRK